MDDAIAAWKKAVEIDPKQLQAVYALVRTLSKTDPKQAKAYEARYHELQSQNSTVERAHTLSNFGLAASNQGKWPEAIAQFKEAIQVCGNCEDAPVLHKNLGLTECQAGQLDDGEKELLAAQKALPNDPDILRALQILQGIRAKNGQKSP